MSDRIHPSGRPVARLLQASDGLLYGTTSYGTTSFSGTIFRLTNSGALDTLHVFSGTDDGGEPFAPLIQAADGHLYGTTSTGGTGAAGTIFRISPAGAFSVLRRFNLDVDGGFPYAGLLEGSDGLLYGTAQGGGAAGMGTAFRVSPAGAVRSPA
jgi:uncharacterized repeat protein (TIGR03803 family)